MRLSCGYGWTPRIREAVERLGALATSMLRFSGREWTLMPGRNGDTLTQRWLAVSQQQLEGTMKSEPDQSRCLYGEAVVNWSKMPATQIPGTSGSASVRGRQFGDFQARVIEYGPNYLDD